MKAVSIGLSLLLIALPCAAGTGEASANFWREFDITFWQTLPFAMLWMYFTDTQLSRLMYPALADPHWQAVMTFSLIISAGNAYIRASEVSRPALTR